jgi:transposase
MVSSGAGRASSWRSPPHTSQQGRIQAVGLCQLAGGFGEAAGLTGIDLHHRKSRLGQGTFKHTHKEFIKFLSAVERAVPAGKLIHAIADNYAAHKHPKVREWLADHPRWVIHFTPTSASWLNAVEGFFSIITRRRIRRGVFKSVSDLQDAIRRYIKEHNRSSKPFVWTKPAAGILAKLKRLPAPSE